VVGQRATEREHVQRAWEAVRTAVARLG